MFEFLFFKYGRCLVMIACCLTISISDAQSIYPVDYQDLNYRMIGPFRAGRAVGGTGVPSRRARLNPT